MALNVTPVNRNLQTRVTFMCLEFEDLFVVLGAAAVTNVVGHFVGGRLPGMPMSIVVQYGVPFFVVPLLMFFKYGRPRGYVRDLALWYMKPRAYCAVARDREIRSAYQGGIAVPLTLEQHEKEPPGARVMRATCRSAITSTTWWCARTALLSRAMN